MLIASMEEHPMKNNRRRFSGKPRVSSSILERINPNAAGIDCGSARISWVPIDPVPIRSFHLHRRPGRLPWLVTRRITSVAMEATGSTDSGLRDFKERGIEVGQRPPSEEWLAGVDARLRMDSRTAQRRSARCFRRRYCRPSRYTATRELD
jgi:hypothetical protein